MKKFYVNQKWFSFGDQFNVVDESNNVAYYVNERLFSFGKQYTIYSNNDEEKAYIRQKMFRFLPQFNLFMNDEEVATVSKRFTFLVSKYDITSSFGDYTIDGDFMSWNFDIIKNGEVVCNVSKNFNLFKDKYEITVHDEVNEVFAISLVIIIDAIHHDNRRK